MKKLIKIEPNIDNPHSTEKWIIKMKIENLKEAIENLGHETMQTIHISSHNMGMGTALRCGKYIDLSEETFVFPYIKKCLQDMLQIQEELLTEITKQTII